ncbi:MAG TPA: hypothetical protein VMT43_06415 [Acidimicrobiales bacterium]|nr:hypothetical protein [Acidimicrobiales bacterium]
MKIRRADRVRIHLIDRERPQPSVEGVLVRKGGEYVVAVPQLLVSPERDPVGLDDAKFLVIPRENIAFYEVIR